MVGILLGRTVSGVQAGLVSNQTRACAVDPGAQGRINSLYMTATFFGGAIGVALSGRLMTRFGWIGIAAFGVLVSMTAALIHFPDGRGTRQAVVAPATLKLNQNIDDFEEFYGLLDASHAGLDRSQSQILNAQLVLLLSNHIGDMNVLRQVFAAARVKLETIN